MRQIWSIPGAACKEVWGNVGVKPFENLYQKRKSLKRFHFKLSGTPSRNRTSN